jgi:AcrR family transcriptional regulator
MPRLTERTRDARRHQILDAARRCFIRDGFQATSMHDIFAEAGVSAGSVYSHFTGREEIVAAIADEVIAEFTSTLDAAVADNDPPTLDAVLDHFFQTLQRADIATIAVAVWAEAVRDPALGQRLATRYRRMRRDFTRLVRIEQQRGTIDPDTSATHIAHLLTALGPAFLHQRAFDSAATAAMFTQGLRGLRRPP